MAVAELARVWWSWIAPATLQATWLLAAAWLADRALRKRAWPQILTTLWLVALARLVLPPSIASPWSVTRALGAPSASIAAAAPSGAWLQLLAALWLAGVLASFALRWSRRRRLAAREAAQAMGLRRSPRIGTLAGLATPAVSGLLRPTLLLPRDWLSRAPGMRARHALLHEVAHVRRGDLWLDELCHALRSLFWFHPLVWFAARRIHALGELACDADVARVLGREAPAYRDTLVLAARDVLARGEPPLARALVGDCSQITARVEHLHRSSMPSRALVRGASTVLALVLAACVLPMDARSLELRAQAQRVFDDELAGRPQSCFRLQAAAMVLAADP